MNVITQIFSVGYLRNLRMVKRGFALLGLIFLTTHASFSIANDYSIERGSIKFGKEGWIQIIYGSKKETPLEYTEEENIVEVIVGKALPDIRGKARGVVLLRGESGKIYLYSSRVHFSKNSMRLNYFKDPNKSIISYELTPERNLFITVSFVSATKSFQYTQYLIVEDRMVCVVNENPIPGFSSLSVRSDISHPIDTQYPIYIQYPIYTPYQK